MEILHPPLSSPEIGKSSSRVPPPAILGPLERGESGECLTAVSSPDTSHRRPRARYAGLLQESFSAAPLRGRHPAFPPALRHPGAAVPSPHLLLREFFSAAPPLPPPPLPPRLCRPALASPPPPPCLRRSTPTRLRHIASSTGSTSPAPAARAPQRHDKKYQLSRSPNSARNEFSGKPHVQWQPPHVQPQPHVRPQRRAEPPPHVQPQQPVVLSRSACCCTSLCCPRPATAPTLPTGSTLATVSRPTTAPSRRADSRDPPPPACGTA